MNKTVRKIILIALLAVDVACLLIPWWRFSIIITIIINGMNVIRGSIIRTVVIFATYIVSVIFLEKKPKIFFITGLCALSMYLAVVFYEWGFRFSKMPGAYVEILAVIGTMVAYVLMTIIALNDNLMNKKLKKKTTVVAISLGVAVAFAVVISLVVSGVVKCVEKKSEQKKNSTLSTGRLVSVEETKESDEDKTIEAETQAPTEEDLEKETESVAVRKDITEADFELYKESIEWFLFNKVTVSKYKDEMINYEKYISKDLLESGLSQCANTDINSQKVFPLFEKNGDIYNLKLDENRNTMYGDYLEMMATMSADAEANYKISFLNDNMNKESVLKYVYESVGYTNISILSVDNENRTMRVYDSVHNCYYTCTYDMDGKINTIKVEDEDKKVYRTIYDFLVKKLKDSDSFVCGIRDFNGDGKLEVLLGETDFKEQYVEIYQYDNGEMKLITTYDVQFFETVIGLTEDGYLLDATYYVPTIKSYRLQNDEIVMVFDSNDILDTLYGRDIHVLNDSTIQLFAETHHIKEDIEREYAEKNKDWVNSYKNFLLNYDSRELINQPVLEMMGAYGEGGTVKGFFLYDVNNDGQPELMVQKVYGANFSGTLLYTYNSETKTVENYGTGTEDVFYLKNEKGDTLTDSADVEMYKNMNGNGLLLYDGVQALGYRKDNGWIIAFSWNGGTFDKGVGITAFMEINSDGSESHTIYRESFDNGEASGESSLSQRDKTLYEAIMNNYVPFMFRTITVDNINKYVVNDYKNSGLYNYTLEECEVFYSQENATN